MSAPTPSQTGGCLCGAVRYHLVEAPKELGACHCGMCRKFSGGIELGIQLMPDGIVFEAQDTLKIFKSSDWAERGFCSTCGSSLFWRLTAPGPMEGLIALAAGTLDSLDGLTLNNEVYIDHKPAAYAFAGETHQMTEADIMAMVAAAGADDAGAPRDE